MLIQPYYKQEYVIVKNAIYTVKEAKQFFKQEQYETMSAEKLYRYPSVKKMQTNITYQIKKLQQTHQITPAKNSYENYKIANQILTYLLSTIQIDMRVIEDRLLGFKNRKEELETKKTQVENAYQKGIYQKEKEFKKHKRFLKKLEKQTKLQNIRMLFNTLVRKKTANQDETYTLFYLLNQFHINAYKLTGKDKQGNFITMALVPYKLNQYDSIQYYAYHLNKYHTQMLQETQGNHLFKLLGKELLKEIEVISIETSNNVFYLEQKEYQKILRQLGKETLEINYNQ